MDQKTIQKKTREAERALLEQDAKRELRLASELESAKLSARTLWHLAERYADDGDGDGETPLVDVRMDYYERIDRRLQECVARAHVLRQRAEARGWELRLVELKARLDHEVYTRESLHPTPLLQQTEVCENLDMAIKACGRAYSRLYGMPGESWTPEVVVSAERTLIAQLNRVLRRADLGAGRPDDDE